MRFGCGAGQAEEDKEEEKEKEEEGRARVAGALCAFLISGTFHTMPANTLILKSE
jgi:hypothetical protein